MTTGKVSFDTPSFALAILNFRKTDQAFREWVVLQAQFLDHLVKEYSNEFGSSFSITDFRDKFLQSQLDLDVILLFSYTIARLMKLRDAPRYTMQNSFVGQLQLNFLGDIALVIEEALRLMSKKDEMLKGQLEWFSDQHQMSLGSNKLGEVNEKFIANFDTTLENILDSSFTFKNKEKLLGKEKSLAVVYGIRNYRAHTAAASTVVWNRFEQIQQEVLNCLFAIVEGIY